MTETFETILRTYGRAVTLRHGGETCALCAFLQRIQKQETDAPQEETNFGAADLRRWLYIGPPQQSVEAGDLVCAEEGEFVVQTAAAIYAGGEKSHWWAILRPAREVLV